jgi:putative membrane protein
MVRNPREQLTTNSVSRGGMSFALFGASPNNGCWGKTVAKPFEESVMKRAGIFVAAVVVSSFMGAAGGGDKTERPLDKDFLIKAATANHAEIQFGKLADKRAGSTQVKDYAAMLVKEHQSAYEQLAKLLQNRKIGVVAGLEKETRDEISRLGKLEGVAFDRAFLQCMIKEHNDAIAIFEYQAKNGREGDIRSYANDLLPSLRSHLKQAKELAKSADK